MRKTMARGLVLIALLTLIRSATPPSTVKGQEVMLQDSGLYVEDFTTYTYRDTATTADWNVLQGVLQLPLKDAVGQSDPTVACDESGNTLVVWRIRDAIYAHKYDPSGNPLWLEAVQVNAAGLVTSGPTVALDSVSNAVVVWHDERNGDWDVYAQKLSPDGLRLWASDKLVSVGNSTAPYYPVETAPAIAADGDQFFVAWHDYRGGWDIYAQRLDGDGNRLWPSDVRVNRDHPGSNRWPHAAASDGRFSVVWTECDADYLYAQQLDSSGAHQWATDTLVSDQYGSSFVNHVTMGANGASIVAWSDRETYMQRLSASGTRMWTTDLQVTTADSRGLGLASLAGGSTIIAWREYDGLIYTQRVTADATWEWPEALAVSDGGTAEYWYSFGMAIDPIGRVSLAWVDDRTQDQDIYLQRFTQDRQRLWQADRRANTPTGAAAQVSPSVAAGAGYRVLTWVDFRGGGDVYVQKVDDSGTRLWSNDIRVNATPGFAVGSGTAVALAMDESSVIVWVDKRSGGEDIYVQRIDASGNRLWASDVRVNTTPGNWMLEPRVAVAPSGDTVVTWWGNGYLYAQRLNETGERLWDSDIFIHYGNDYDMAVDSAGNSLVTWWEYRHGGGWPEPPDIFVQKIDSDGNLLWDDGGIEVDLNSNGWHLYPAVAVDGSDNVWIAWDDAHSTDGDIYLQRLNSNGGHLWSSDQLVSSDGTGSRQEAPEIGIDGDGNAVVTWQDYRNDLGDYSKIDIYAQHVSPTGSLLWGDDVLVNEASGDPWLPSLAVSGSNISVAWVDLRDSDPNIYTQRLTTAGARGWGADLNAVQSDHFYLPSGIAQSHTVDTTLDDITAATLTAQYILQGGNVTFYLTNNGGQHWAQVTPGVTHVFTTTGSDLRWRAELTADPTWSHTPVVNSLRIEYPANPVPTITSLSPSSTTAGGGDFTLTVNGMNFVSDSVVRWNGSDRETTFVSSTQLRAEITAADIATAGSATVTVFNPTPGGGTSNAKTFTISNPNPRTLILTNQAKLESFYGASEASQLMSKLNELAEHSSVQGLVVQVEDDLAVAAAYSQWDANNTTTRANAVADAIKNLLDGLLNTYSDVEYIVLVGDDRVIPYRRVLDQTGYPESTYGCVSSSSTIGVALGDDMSLTDDFYTDKVPTVPDDLDWDGHDLYIPDYASGRLIETPSEIIAIIDTFLSDSNVTLGSAISVGYDFVQDAAQEMCDSFTADGIPADCTLIGDSWSADQFRSRVLDIQHEAISLNQHAYHAGFGAPTGGGISSSDFAGASADLTRIIFYSVGCHAGLNVPPDNPCGSLDLAQAIAQNSANYLANTGYGWGYGGSVGLSEKLMLNFTEQLLEGQSATLGGTLVNAKHDYYTTEYYFDYYDEKIMIETWLLGLPMYRFTTPAAAASAQFSDVVEDTHFTTLANGLSKNSVTYQFPALTTETTDDGVYYSLDGVVESANGQPIQPKYTTNADFPGTTAHGLVFTGGQYGDITSFDPVIEQALTLTVASPILGEPPLPTAPNWHPATFFSLNSLETLSGMTANLVSVLGQFNPNSGVERLYDEISFDIYYHTSSNDWATPVITSVSSAANGSATDLTVGCTDASGIYKVVIAYTADDGSWHSSDLAWDSGEGMWTSTIPITTSIEYFVQAVDNAGNVTSDDNNGAYYCAVFGDFDGSGQVGVDDIMEVANQWRTTSDDPDWESRYDLNGDGIITVVDIMLVVAHWGETCD